MSYSGKKIACTAGRSSKIDHRSYSLFGKAVAGVRFGQPVADTISGRLDTQVIHPANELVLIVDTETPIPLSTPCQLRFEIADAGLSWSR